MISFLPKPMPGEITYYGDSPSVPVLILGYDDNEGEWVAVKEDGQLDTCQWGLIRFSPAVPA